MLLVFISRAGVAISQGKTMLQDPRKKARGTSRAYRIRTLMIPKLSLPIIAWSCLPQSSDLTPITNGSRG